MAKELEPTAPLPDGRVEAWIVGTHELPPHLMEYQGLIGMVVVEAPGGTVDVLRQEDFDGPLGYEWIYE